MKFLEANPKKAGEPENKMKKGSRPDQGGADQKAAPSSTKKDDAKKTPDAPV